MRSTMMATAGLLILLPALARGQEPVKSFDQLNTRLRVGDKVLVTDTQGREHRGKISDLSSSELVLGSDGTRLASADVHLVREWERDSLKNGALIGMGSAAAFVGGAMAAACAGQADCAPSAGWTTFVVAFYAGVGAAIGMGIDALVPGKKRVVYRAPEGETAPRMLLTPIMVTPRSIALTMSLSF